MIHTYFINEYYLKMIQSLDDRQLMDEIHRQEYNIDDIIQGLMAAQDSNFSPSCEGLYISWCRLRTLLDEQEERVSNFLNDNDKRSHECNNKGQRYEKFMEALPCEFKTADALDIAESLDIPARTAERWLKDFTRTGHGHYRKAKPAEPNQNGQHD